MLALAIACAACGTKRETALPAGSTVLIIGDSITAGFGITAAEAWPAQLGNKSGWNVIAAGVSGDRTEGGRARLPALLDEHKPALVIIELGGNDMLRGVATADIVANLDAMIAAVRGHGAAVVLMAAPQPTAMGALTGYSAAALYRDLATSTQVPLIEKAMPAVLSDAKLRLDAVHPTAEGHAILATRAAEELSQLGLLKR